MTYGILCSIVLDYMTEKGPISRSPEELPSIEALTDRTVERFLRQKTFDPTLPVHPLHGKELAGYTLNQASFDVVQDLVDSGANVRILAGKLLATAQAAPRDIIDWGGLDDTSWDDVSQFIAREILLCEVMEKHPELLQEDRRRLSFHRVRI